MVGLVFDFIYRKLLGPRSQVWIGSISTLAGSSRVPWSGFRVFMFQCPIFFSGMIAASIFRFSRAFAVFFVKTAKWYTPRNPNLTNSVFPLGIFWNPLHGSFQRPVLGLGLLLSWQSKVPPQSYPPPKATPPNKYGLIKGLLTIGFP